MRWLDSITADSMNMSLSLNKLWELTIERSVACYSPWGHNETDTTEQLN